MSPFHKAQGSISEFSYFVVDDDISHWHPVQNLENQEIDKSWDYAINAGLFVVYIASSGPKIINFESNNLLFRKNKIYPILTKNGGESIIVAGDELSNKFNIMDVWHSVFYFIKEEDLLLAERFLKLKKLK